MVYIMIYRVAVSIIEHIFDSGRLRGENAPAQKALSAELMAINSSFSRVAFVPGLALQRCYARMPHIDRPNGSTTPAPDLPRFTQLAELRVTFMVNKKRARPVCWLLGSSVRFFGDFMQKFSQPISHFPSRVVRFIFQNNTQIIHGDYLKFFSQTHHLQAAKYKSIPYPDY